MDNEEMKKRATAYVAGASAFCDFAAGPGAAIVKRIMEKSALDYEKLKDDIVQTIKDYPELLLGGAGTLGGLGVSSALEQNPIKGAVIGGGLGTGIGALIRGMGGKPEPRSGSDQPSKPRTSAPMKERSTQSQLEAITGSRDYSKIAPLAPVYLGNGRFVFNPAMENPDSLFNAVTVGANQGLIARMLGLQDVFWAKLWE